MEEIYKKNATVLNICNITTWSLTLEQDRHNY